MSQEIAERSTDKNIIDKIIIDRKQGVITFDLTPSDVIHYSDLPRIIDKVFKEFQNTEIEVVKITGRGPVWGLGFMLVDVVYRQPLASSSSGHLSSVPMSLVSTRSG